MVALSICLAIGMLALVTVPVVLSDPKSAATWYLLGGFHAGLIALVISMLRHAFLVHDRHAINQLRGAWGEENTTDELKGAQRRKVIWGWVDSVSLERGDLDHFVVTRQGGLVVLDSKFRTDPDLTVTEQLARDAARVRTRAEGVARTILGAKSKGQRRATGSAFPVRSAVVVWGALQREIAQIETYEGVDIVPGRQLRPWLASLEGDPVTEQAALEVLVGLREFRATQRATGRG